MKRIERENAWKKRIELAFYQFKRRSPLPLIGLFLILGLIFISIFGDYIAPYPEDAREVHFHQQFQPPSLKHPFGTDFEGRDVFSRVILGTRISLFAAIYVLAIALMIGIPTGLISGYIGGTLDSVIMRIVEIFLSIPSIVLALAVCVALSPSLMNSMLAIAFVWWPGYARLVRGEVLHLKEESYVEAAQSFGASTLRIVFMEILPNTLAPIIVKASIDIGFVILVESALGFLGIGAQPPTPEWGAIASWGRSYLPEKWWITVFPGLAIFLTVFAFSVFGDGLTDVFGGGE